MLVVLIFPAGRLAARDKPTCTPFSNVAVPRALAIQQIECKWVARRLLIMGEIHGTTEIPALLAGLVVAQSANRPIRIDIEWPVAQQAAVDRYIQSAGTAAEPAELITGQDWYWKHPDGRMSHAWVALLDKVRELRHQGRDIDVFMMEPDYGDPASIKAAGGYQVVKEAGMARAIQTVLKTAPPDTMVAALMGNFHSRVGKDSPDPDSSVVTRLKTDHPLVLIPYARHQTAWVCVTDGCGPHTYNSSKPGVAVGLMEIKALPDAPSGVLAEKVQLHAITASAPANEVIKQ
jgi:hypothetical protein